MEKWKSEDKPEKTKERGQASKSSSVKQTASKSSSVSQTMRRMFGLGKPEDGDGAR